MLSAAAFAEPGVAASGASWPGVRFHRADRDRAIQRGLRFIYRLAKNSDHLEEFGDDLLWCFYALSVTAADPWLRGNSWRNNPHGGYHSTWTAINGLMDDAWSGERVNFPEALRRGREG